MSGKSIGARVLRTEDARLLTGKGAFVDDISLPGMLHASFVRASFAHARIRGIDSTAALAMEGVHAVFTSADMPRAMQTMRLPMLVPNPYSKISRTAFALAQSEVCYVGDYNGDRFADIADFALRQRKCGSRDFGVRIGHQHRQTHRLHGARHIG